VDRAEPFIAKRIEVADGQARIPALPGTGVEWDGDAVRHYPVE
jgi:L-alanine-DL-glutamate epimerase-like enolase superfamily enzyme